jgi:hypothetical protein
MNRPETGRYQPRKCPECEKVFKPEVEHGWIIGLSDNSSRFVCSYSCQRKWEKRNKLKRRGDKR